MLTQKHSCRGGDPHKRTGDAAAAGRGCFKLLRFHRLLRTENHGMVVHTQSTQLLAHNSGKGAAAGL